jgi:hypothetical protein
MIPLIRRFSHMELLGCGKNAIVITWFHTSICLLKPAGQSFLYIIHSLNRENTSFYTFNRKTLNRFWWSFSSDFVCLHKFSVLPETQWHIWSPVMWTRYRYSRWQHYIQLLTLWNIISSHIQRLLYVKKKQTLLTEMYKMCWDSLCCTVVGFEVSLP